MGGVRYCIRSLLSRVLEVLVGELDFFDGDLPDDLDCVELMAASSNIACCSVWAPCPIVSLEVVNASTLLPSASTLLPSASESFIGFFIFRPLALGPLCFSFACNPFPNDSGGDIFLIRADWRGSSFSDIFRLRLARGGRGARLPLVGWSSKGSRGVGVKP